MKIVLRVLGLITVVVTLLICSLGAIRNFADAEDVGALESEMAASKAQIDAMMKESEQMGASSPETLAAVKEAQDAMNSIPSKSTFTAAGSILAVLALISIVCAIFLFVYNPKVATLLLVLTVILSITVIVISPSIEGGITSGATNRALAIAGAIPAFLTALFTFLANRKTA